MKPAWRIFRALILERPGLFLFLSIFYGFAALIAAFVGTEKEWTAVIILSAVPTVAIFAMATERAMKYAMNAGAIGLPDHARHTRSAQSMIAFIFIGIPWLCTIILSGPLLLTSAALLFFAAIGIILAERKILLIPLVLAVVGLNAIYGEMAWIDKPMAHIGALAIAVYCIHRWMALPLAMEAAGREQIHWLADAGHENGDDIMAEALGSTPATVARYETQIDEATQRAIASISAAGVSPHAIAYGFGFNSRFRLKVALQGMALALAALTLWHFLRNGVGDETGYFVVSGFCALAILGRISDFEAVWKATQHEQSILALSPVWPPRERLKIQFVLMLPRTQLGGWITWLVITLAVWQLGWVQNEVIQFAMIVLFAVTCASNGTLWAVMTRRSLRDWHASTIMIGLATVIGIAFVKLGSGVELVVTGWSLILVPPALCLSALILRPLQFPVVRT